MKVQRVFGTPLLVGILVVVSACSDHTEPGPTAPLGVSRLTSTISASDTALPIADVSVFPDSGTVKIDDELIPYNGTHSHDRGAARVVEVPGTLDNAVRGTDATVHIAGALVVLQVTPTPTVVPPPINLGSSVPITTSGTTVGAPNLMTGASCGGGGKSAPDASFLFTAAVAASYTFDTLGSGFDTILYVRNGSRSGAELACNDDAGGTTIQSRVTLTLAAGQSVVIVVDGFGTLSGLYTLHIIRNGSLPTSTPAPSTTTPTLTPTRSGTATIGATVTATATATATNTPLPPTTTPTRTSSATATVTPTFTTVAATPTPTQPIHLVSFQPGIGTARGVAVDQRCTNLSSPKYLRACVQHADCDSVGTHDGVCSTIAYVASGQYGLSVANVTNPAAPTVLGTADVPFNGRAVALAGTRAVVAGAAESGQAALWVLDISVPSSPVVLGRLTTNVVAQFDYVALNAAGTMAVVTLHNLGVWTVDLSNPAAPVRRGGLDTAGDAQGVALSGTLAYVADGSNGLLVMDVSAPTAPRVVGSLIVSAHSLTDVAVNGLMAYAVDQQATLNVINVATPILPVLVRSFPLSGVSIHVAASSGRVAALTQSSTNGDKLDLIDVTVPTIPSLLSSVPIGPFLSGQGVALTATYAYIGASADGLKTYSVGTSSLVGSAADPFVGWNVARAGNIALVVGGDRATNTARLRVLDVSQPDTPRVLASIGTAAAARFYDVAINTAGTLAVVTLDTLGLWTLDLTNPAAPTWVGSLDTAGSAEGVVLNGTLAYLADGSNGLLIVDVSTPSAPRVVGNKIISLHSLTDVAVDGTTAYAVDQQGSLEIFNVSTPSLPTLLKSFALGGVSHHVAASSGRVVALTEISTGDQFVLINVGLPSLPSRLSSVGIGPFLSGQGVTLTPTRVYIGASAGGLQIYDISTPALPTVVASGLALGQAHGVAVGGSLAYVADYPATLSIIQTGP